ncbi:unnamed protein product [Oikopleura dioica]|uniref:Arylesterase n=1 Tax=Oikopleura dioica TaxID=34765 RepID=E4X240_OIKDI|nr:unnamed protein product [Oikopleura dioica]
MSLLFELFGFVGICWLAFIVNCQLEIYGFKRNLHEREIALHGFSCEEIRMEGADTISITSDGLAFMTSGLKYPPLDAPPADGVVYMIDLTTDGGDPIKVDILAPFDPYKLNPHGIRVYEPGDGRILVYISNHGLGLDKVEKFEYSVSKNQLKWINSFKQKKEFYSLNDIEMIAEDDFFFVNDQYFSIRQRFLRFLEYNSFVRFGSLGYCNKGNCQLATKHNLGYPSGISIRSTRDENGQFRKELIVVEKRAFRASTYHLDPSNGFVFSHTIPLPANMDNIFNDGEDIFFAGSPRGSNGDDLVEVVKLNTKNELETVISTVLPIKGVTSYAHFENKMLFGTQNSHLLICTRD